ncbi:hypothetical protein ANN_18353 [Periplaneta americana]|uniref:Uncharacterized protein n=1 Tax=Periplaneta americana TaxID=6978 RepID=A0ABQ8SPQ1_PERAM|nr:hypothetical protein ANN_18353 [Periplaneta americana]
MEEELEEEQFGFRKGKGMKKAFDTMDWSELKGILKKIGMGASAREGPRPTSRLLASRPHAEAEVDDHPTRMEKLPADRCQQPAVAPAVTGPRSHNSGDPKLLCVGALRNRLIHCSAVKNLFFETVTIACGVPKILREKHEERDEDKIAQCNVISKPSLQYGSEKWVMREEDKRRIETSEMIFMRSLLEVSLSDKKTIAIKRSIFCGPLEKEVRKRLLRYFVWNVTETWTLRRSEEKRLEAYEKWIWRRMECMKWTDRIRNEAVLERVDEERMMLKLFRKRKIN